MAIKPPTPARLSLSGFIAHDFPYIRRASIMLAGCLAVAASIAGGGAYFLHSQQRDKGNAQAVNAEARERLAQTEADQREIVDFQPKYQQLVARGFVGDERRLEWVEAIKAGQKQYRLAPIGYEFLPQKPLQLDDPAVTGDLELRATRMQLNMGLLHEEDLLRFLRDLRVAAWFVPTECKLARASESSIDPLAPRLSAECTLAWLSIGSRAVDGQAAQE